jgi:hypothetical protein
MTNAMKLLLIVGLVFGAFASFADYGAKARRKRIRTLNKG